MNEMISKIKDDSFVFNHWGVEVPDGRILSDEKTGPLFATQEEATQFLTAARESYNNSIDWQDGIHVNWSSSNVCEVAVGQIYQGYSEMPYKHGFSDIYNHS